MKTIMSQPIAYFDDKLVPATEIAISVGDTGFLMGVTIAEQLRTFGGKLFQLDAHLARLERCLAIIGLNIPLSVAQLAELAQEVVEYNFKLLAAGDDLGLTIFVTPGMHDPAHPKFGQPTIGMHTRPVAFAQWADKYATGESLCTTSIQQVPPECWPSELKCRSRMHYFLADRAAQLAFPSSRALMLDSDGWITEATTANVLIYHKETGILIPPREKVLPGISLAMLEKLAAELNITVTQQDIAPQDVAAADEVWLCSTSPCILPVVRFNGQPIGNGQPGQVFQQLLIAWSKAVSLDIVRQAQQFKIR